jgi:hypothetical protein
MVTISWLESLIPTSDGRELSAVILNSRNEDNDVY